MKNIFSLIFLICVVFLSVKAQSPDLKKIIKSADDRFEMQDFFEMQMHCISRAPRLEA